MNVLRSFRYAMWLIEIIHYQARLSMEMRMNSGNDNDDMDMSRMKVHFSRGFLIERWGPFH